ncbi:glycoside hydrolase family 47 protein [Venturia nashicola]|uniref:alpha-1,2-Mannosidase n=1 Tax=Venturia nashicola TaxID=86259 RepID=A0A4Z1PWR9_9PEZI|nr:glycoside hydrolase family 47 protein [Venturia nashicola]
MLWLRTQVGQASCAIIRPWLVILAAVYLATFAVCMTDDQLRSLRQETRDIFYHGFENYMRYAFPEDELKPLSCAPLTRDRANPAHIELNDVLGNYSLTLIDSLSTLAIIASSPPQKAQDKALGLFQDGISQLIDQYGDGTDGPSGQGLRARGFDVDSKVQVFETVIRGVGGLLSAHQFAVGDLPIRGYDASTKTKHGETGIHWKNGFVYNGQLLRLAHDLAKRLLPAFHTATGLPYPRVNLRHGVPFYSNSPLNVDLEDGQCPRTPPANAEVTETCSAGAGSLVLEFSTLSRLTGDTRFEDAAKTAFWAVWQRRSSIGLLGSGIDAETGDWVSPYTGIGAGIDSFFEYALKSHVLLSGLPFNQSLASKHSPDAFLEVWEQSHAAIKHHIYRGEQFQHPHYLQVDLYTGALRAFWIDSLSAYYPGLLTLAGELEEAVTTHMMYTALWSRYSALPERWSAATGNIESGLRWWGGRPEFIESTWYIYRATKDPWYLHVGEMALRDIKRRCWTKCGWAGLQDVRTGELSDRMESFFLGETAKYLFLLFDDQHPLNALDAAFVFTTEGHPLTIPKRLRANLRTTTKPDYEPRGNLDTSRRLRLAPTCPKPPSFLPLTVSSTAARGDVFHAASLVRLHLMPKLETLDSPLVEFNADHPSISLSDIRSPSNYTYYPWTLPMDLVPPQGTSSPMANRATFDLSFPNLPESTTTISTLQRVYEGILVNSMSGLRLGMVKEPLPVASVPSGTDLELFRIYAVSNVALGRDEKVFLTRNLVTTFNPVDPYFTRIRDVQTIDLVVDVGEDTGASHESAAEPQASSLNFSVPIITVDSLSAMTDNAQPSLLASLFQNIQSMLREPLASNARPLVAQPPALERHLFPAAIPTGPGAAPLPDIAEPFDLDTTAIISPLPWNEVHITGNLCDDVLDAQTVKENQVLVIKRGGCSFSTKMKNIPSFAPSPRALQMVVIVSFPEQDDVDAQVQQERLNRAEFVQSSSAEPLIQPMLDQDQTTPGGIPRPHPIPAVMLSGGHATIRYFEKAKGVGFRRRFWFESQGVRIGNLIVV